MRAQLKTAQDNEQRLLDGFASASRDRGRSQNLAALADRAASLAANLDGTDQAIDRSVGQGLDEVKVLLAAEKQNLETYKQELNSDEQDARSVGAQVLAASFKDVTVDVHISRTVCHPPTQLLRLVGADLDPLHRTVGDELFLVGEVREVRLGLVRVARSVAAMSARSGLMPSLVTAARLDGRLGCSISTACASRTLLHGALIHFQGRR